MADDRIDVKVGATTGELKTGMAQAEQTVKQGVAGMQSPFDRMRESVTGGMKQMHSEVKASLDGIGTVFNNLSKIALGVGAILVGGSWFKGIIDDTVKWNAEALKLSVTLGITTEEASALNEAVQDLGVATLNPNLNVSTLTRALNMMQRELGTNEKAFNDLGIATRDSNGEFKNSLDIFLAAMGYLKGLDGETARNVTGIQLFKRSWAEVRPLMGLTEEAIAKTSEELQKQGRLVTTEGIQKSIDYKKALDELDDSFHGFTLTIGNVVTPVLASLARVINMVSVGTVTLTNDLKTMWSYWKGANWSGGLIDYMGAGYTVEPERKSGGTPPPKSPGSGGGGGGGGGGGKGGGGASLVQQWVAELEQMKAAEEKFQSQSLQMEKAFWAKKLATGKVATEEEKEALKAQELASEAIRLKAETDYWKGKLLLAGEGTKEYQEVQHKIGGLEQQQNKARLQSEIELSKSKIKAGQDTIKDKMALIEHESQLDKLDLKMKQDNIAHLAKMGALSRVAELKEYKKLKQAEHLIDLEEEKKKAIKKAIANKGDLKAYKKHLDDLKLLKKKQALELQQMDFDITEAMKAEWGQVWNSVSQAFSMSVQGIITGTTTLADAIKNIWQSILTSLVGMFLQIALEYIASTVMMLIFGKASDKARAASAVGAQAGIAGAAGVASVMVALPFPVNVSTAPKVGVAAAALAASFGVLASAAGGWDVPHDTLAMVHKDEKILPADWPEKLRAVAAPGGRAAGGVKIEKLTFAPTLVMKQPMTHAYANEIVRKYLFPAFQDELERFGAGLGRG